MTLLVKIIGWTIALAFYLGAAILLGKILKGNRKHYPKVNSRKFESCMPVIRHPTKTVTYSKGKEGYFWREEDDV